MKVQMNTMLRSALLASAASASLLAVPSYAQAQSGGSEAVDVGEIVVTGSRIRRDTFNAPTPLSVVSSEVIRESGQVSLGDVLLEQPNINANTNAQNSSGSLFLSGQARADIRGLGATRTLVLMDGRRLPFSDTQSPAVDLNTIPSLMIDRIETIAGGASAIYGSEAIAGVVNFIMKKEQDGLELDLQAGISEHGDGETGRYGFNYGRKFMDDKLSILIGGEYASEDKVLQKDRDELFPGIRRDTRVTPQPILDPTSRSSTAPTATFQLLGGALGTARAVTLDYRNPTNVVRLSAACSTPTVQPDCQDEALFYSAVFNALQGKSDRAVARTYIDYKITDTWHAFLEGSYVKANGYGIFQPAFSSGAGGGTMPVALRGDNAFLNGGGATAAALRAEWLAAGKTLTQGSTAQVAKFWQEFGGRNVKTAREQYKFATGFAGEFETFGRKVNVDGYAQFARLDGTTTSYGVPYVARVQQATDAVVVGGQVVCRDATARANGCVPWDLVNGPSREAINYANGVATTEGVSKQTVGGVNFATNLFTLPAGELGVAFGAEYRKEESIFLQDPISGSGQLFFNGGLSPQGGQYTVKEIYGEVRVPILKDLPFAYELSFEGALRQADYSTIHGTNQYRLHGTWAPFKDIRFRATTATAVRAPNIANLFSPQGRNFTTAALDPCDKDVFRGASAAQQAARRVTCAAAIPGYNSATFTSNIGTGRPSLALLQGGNPGLGPEKAHTYEYGVVIQPRWIPNLSVSVDYFKYNLTDAIGTIPINTLFQNLCYDSTQPVAGNPFCALIQRDSTGATTGGLVGGVSQVILTNQNVSSIKVEGYDYSVSYGFHTEDVFGKDYGTIAMRVDATWMYRFASQGLPGQAYTQFANTINNATPEWKANASARWSYDKYSFTWSTIYIGSMISNNAVLPTVLTPYMTGDYFRHDIRASYKFNDQMTFRAGVINLFDRYPPALPETFSGTGGGSSTFDNRGRYFFIGANMNF